MKAIIVDDQLHKKLSFLKVKLERVSLSDVIFEIYSFYEAANVDKTRDMIRGDDFIEKDNS